MPDWLTTPTIFPYAASEAAAFPNNAREGTLHVYGGTAQLQRIDDVGVWETFETLPAGGHIIAVTASPAIRITPAGGARFTFTWV